MQLSILNQLDKTVSQELSADLKALFTAVLQGEQLPGELEISLVFVDDQEIRRLNREYRQEDSTTDVLSFAQREETAGEPVLQPPGELELLGDIVISLPTAGRQAAEYGHSLPREIAYLAVHGLLHLLGYDHLTEADKKVMRRKEEHYLGEQGFTR